MPKRPEALDKFVRLNLIGEIVEVVGFDSTNITVKYRGKNLTITLRGLPRYSRRSGGGSQAHFRLEGVLQPFLLGH